MKGYPIIHSRNFICDFNSNFFMRPNDLNVMITRQKIIAATDKIDTLDGFRYIAFQSEKYTVFGIVGTVKNLIYKSELTDNEKKDLLAYSFDEKKRLVYTFLGFCVKDYISNEQEIPSLTPNDYLDLLKKYVIPNWKKTTTDTIFSDEYEIDMQTKKYNYINVIRPDYRDELHYYYISGNNDLAIFEDCLNKLISGKNNLISCCTNISDFSVVNKGEFSIYSTNINTIERIKKRKTEKNCSNTEELSSAESEKPNDKDLNSNKAATINKKKILCLIILIILCLILLWRK